MAKKKETKKVELKEVSRKEINGAIIITYEDGSVKILSLIHISEPTRPY